MLKHRSRVAPTTMRVEQLLYRFYDIEQIIFPGPNPYQTVPVSSQVGFTS